MNLERTSEHLPLEAPPIEQPPVLERKELPRQDSDMPPAIERVGDAEQPEDMPPKIERSAAVSFGCRPEPAEGRHPLSPSTKDQARALEQLKRGSLPHQGHIVH